MENLVKALVKAQSEMPEFKHNATGMHKATYSTLDSIINAARPVLNKNGLAVIQTMKSYENGMISIVTKLLHDSGEVIDSEMIFNPKPNPQDVGGQITYYRRYSYQSILGICTEKDDDADSLTPQQNKPQQQGEFKFNFGKHKGKTLAQTPKDYLQWLVQQEKTDAKLKQTITNFINNKNIGTNEIPF